MTRLQLSKFTDKVIFMTVVLPALCYLCFLFSVVILSFATLIIPMLGAAWGWDRYHPLNLFSEPFLGSCIVVTFGLLVVVLRFLGSVPGCDHSLKSLWTMVTRRFTCMAIAICVLLALAGMISGFFLGLKA